MMHPVLSSENTLTQVRYLYPLQHDELPTLGHIARETFTQTFSGLMSPDTFQAYMETKLTDAELARQYTEPDNQFYLVKLEQGEGSKTVGFIRTLYPCQKFFEHAPKHVRLPSQGFLLDRFYFLNSTHGTGLAKACMREVFHLARTAGAEAVHLSTWDQNRRAQRFYTKMGYTHAFNAPFHVGNGLVNEDYIYLYRLV
jgi:diamine N-acetyltransferase